MRKIVLDLAVSLDGYIEGRNGEIDWCVMEEDMDFPGFLESIDTIFYGRVSYDQWGNFQPESDVSGTEQEVWKAVHSKQKYVFTRSRGSDDKAIVVNSNLLETVREIQGKAGRDIWLYGGARLIETFVELDLIDLYRISLHPVVLGGGKPLFSKVNERINLQLVTLKTFRSGVVQLIYSPHRI